MLDGLKVISTRDLSSYLDPSVEQQANNDLCSRYWLCDWPSRKEFLSRHKFINDEGLESLDGRIEEAKSMVEISDFERLKIENHIYKVWPTMELRMFFHIRGLCVDFLREIKYEAWRNDLDIKEAIALRIDHEIGNNAEFYDVAEHLITNALARIPLCPFMALAIIQLIWG